MYPIPAVLINSSDHPTCNVRTALLDHAVSISDTLRQIDDALNRWPTPPPGRRLFVVRIQGLKSVELTGKLSDHFPGWPILALVDGEPDATGLYHVSRAGAAQIVPFPFKMEDIQGALDRILTQFGLRLAPSRVVAITGAASGVGATFLSVNLAAELAEGLGIDTVLTELEFGVGRLAGHLDLSPPTSTRDLLSQPEPLTVARVQTGLVQAGDRFRVLVGPYRLAEPYQPAVGRTAELLRALRRLATITIVDVPAGLNETYFESLTLADRILLVGRADVPSVQALKLVRELLTGRGFPEPHLVLNAYDEEESAVHPDRVSEILQVGKPTVVHSDPAAARRCADTGTTLRRTVPGSQARADIARIATTIAHDFGIPIELVQNIPKRSLIRRLFG